MALRIDRTGLELEAGPFYLSLSLAVQAIAWAGLFDIVIDSLARPAPGHWVGAWKTAPGWYDVATPWRRLSVQLGNGWRSDGVAHG